MALALYELAWRPAAALIRRTDAQVAHDRTLAMLRRADDLAILGPLARLANRVAFPGQPTDVGGVRLPHPIVIAAGLVKGDGFGSEDAALAAVDRRRNVVAGWRSLPALVGAVEFGSYTRHPRLGNPGRVVWRDNATRSMQNRIGLRNPGARAAAAHLRAHADALPPTWGVNLAVSPGLADLAESEREIREAAVVLRGGLRGPARAGPAWQTLNLSCPNTEDDPHGSQSGELAGGSAAPSPTVDPAADLGQGRTGPLRRAAAVAGVGMHGDRGSAPSSPPTRGLAPRPPTAAAPASRAPPPTARARHGAAPLGPSSRRPGAGSTSSPAAASSSGRDLLAFQAAGARAAMIYSALVFRGPLAGALILREARKGRRRG